MARRNLKNQPLPGYIEREFRSQILGLARILGWECYFSWTSIHSPAGFPDLVMVKSKRLIFAELKTEIGKVTDKQQGWLDKLAKTEAEVYLWRPHDFDDVAALLQG